MNRSYVSSMSDRAYFEHNVTKCSDSLQGSPRSALYSSPSHTQNFSDLVKMSIQFDQFPYDYCTDPLGQTAPRADIQSQLLVYKAQQIAQSGSFDDCSCSSYSSDVPHCTCGLSKPGKLASSLEKDMMPIKPNYKTTPDSWLSEWESNRFQSMIVPDTTPEYPDTVPYYLNNDRSIYETDPVHPLPLLNANPEHPEKSKAFTGFQRVPNPGNNGREPFNAPSLKQKGSRPRLCHFLFELLADPAKYSGIIEWVDQEQGVFKFLNSAEVASQWGRRRNKPHMKYENFARSLRTYIAKGILTKPRSKLVYRFTKKVY